MAVLKIGSSGVFSDPINRNMTPEEYGIYSRIVDTSRDIHRTGGRDEVEFFLRVFTKDICKEDIDRLNAGWAIQDPIGDAIIQSRPNTVCKAASPLVCALVDYVREWYDSKQNPLRGAFNDGYIDAREVEAYGFTLTNGDDVWLFKIRAGRDCQRSAHLEHLPVLH